MLNMADFATTKEVRDNILTLNGVTFRLSDSEAVKIVETLKGFAESYNPTPVSKDTAEKKVAPKKGLTGLEYHIKKYGKYYCISRGTPKTTSKGREYLKNGGWTTAEKRCINTAIKSLPDIKTIDVPMENGRSFKAWGFSTKKAAEAAMATLPTSFTAEEVAKFERTR